MWGDLVNVVSFVSNLMSAAASGVALYLFFFKRAAISSILSLLLNYSYQLSLAELKEKLERLNDYNASDVDHYETVINILHELVGQVRGNDKLKVIMAAQILSIEAVIAKDVRGKKLTEPAKRALVSEFREKLRHLNVRNIDDLVGGLK